MLRTDRAIAYCLVCQAPKRLHKKIVGTDPYRAPVSACLLCAAPRCQGQLATLRLRWTDSKAYALRLPHNRHMFKQATLEDLKSARPCLWLNPAVSQTLARPVGSEPALGATMEPRLADVQAARARMQRFAPLLATVFGELQATHGQIISPLLRVAPLQEALGLRPQQGQLWIKADHSLPVAGSVKARGGFHEVLQWTEQLARQHGLLGAQDDVRLLASPAARQLLGAHQIAVGSTGNLGLSIGLMSAALGFQATVHMSHDAKAWKKQLLREHGVKVIEYKGDYALAVAQGREQALGMARCHFVDDERSQSLLLGYACAAFELQDQLKAQQLVVDADHPLMVYLPCGVGGAPAGIAWGLDLVFGPHVRCYFAEPCQSPCFMLNMMSPAGHNTSVYALGLSNRTLADGLAVAQASELAAALMRHRLAGCFTVQDDALLTILAQVHDHAGLRIEPSAAAGFVGPGLLGDAGLNHPRGTHVVWTTGGSRLPDSEFQALLEQGHDLLSAR